MKRKYFPIILIIIVFLFYSSIFSEDSIVYDNVIKSMKSELTRSLQDLKLDKNKAPFYIDYNISYQTIYAYNGTLGSESGEGYGKFGVFNIRVKLGDYIDDEISYIKDIYSMDFKNFEDDYKFLMVRAPIDYTTDMINFQLWRLTDFKYKKAIDIMTKKKETESLDVKEVKKKLPHFTKPEPYKVKEIIKF
ncbi:hypothetical protein KAU33_12030, partial [Candidatus Dependentiae bacterium]|nr:hypothetical protein [Candidatus Dependentiae bacterium]